MSGNPDTSVSRRGFLKLTVVAAAGLALEPGWQAFAAGESLPRLLPGGRIMETAEGLIPVSDYRVIDGDSISKIAAGFGTRADLIVAANADTVVDPNRIFPGQNLKVPKYPVNDPLMFIPEADVIRHQVRPGETNSDIAARYAVAELAVSLAKVTRKGADTYLAIKASPAPMIPVTINYDGAGLLPKDVVSSLIQRIAHVLAYYLGGEQYLWSLRSTGVAISHTDDPGNLGYRPPNDIAVPLPENSREGWLLKLLGHELGHGLGDFGWSPAAREGAAGRIGSGWVSGRLEFDPVMVGPYYEVGYYDRVNGPPLGELNANSRDPRARILAVEAWKRIDDFATAAGRPPVLPSLLRQWLLLPPRSRPGRDSQVYNWAESALFRAYGTDFAVGLIKFIRQQHILFTPEFPTSSDQPAGSD